MGLKAKRSSSLAVLIVKEKQGLGVFGTGFGSVVNKLFNINSIIKNNNPIVKFQFIAAALFYNTFHYE